MDVDKIEAPSKKVDEMRFDPHIVAAFVSPSGNGLKALFAIPNDVKKHQDAFESAKRYLSTYGLKADESGKDVSRLCFLSHDKEIHYAPDAVELPVVIDKERIEHVTRAVKGDRIGDRYEQSSDVRERSKGILQRSGWQIQRGDSERTYCTRPGKNSGVSGELRNDGSFFCYSDSASPLEPLHNYSAFALCTIVEHGGDFKKAAKALAEEFGDKTNVDAKDFYNKNTSFSEYTEKKEIEVDAKKREAMGRVPTWTFACDTPEDLTKIILQRYPA